MGLRFSHSDEARNPAIERARNVLDEAVLVFATEVERIANAGAQGEAANGVLDAAIAWKAAYDEWREYEAWRVRAKGSREDRRERWEREEALKRKEWAARTALGNSVDALLSERAAAGRAQREEATR